MKLPAPGTRPNQGDCILGISAARERLKPSAGSQNTLKRVRPAPGNPVFNGFCLPDAAFQPALPEYALALALPRARSGLEFAVSHY